MVDNNLLLDRYQVIDTLGEGGFSRVVKALDTKMEREVAVKIIAASKKTAVRALREAKTVALLNHPNIVTLHEFEERNDYYYLIMELVEGRSVADMLDRYERFPAEMATAVAMSVCEALECAHTNDVIHRDIKPGNLRIMDDGHVKVMDFGIARLRSAAKTSGVTADGEIVGTFAYMSPEQSGGEQIDERSDIFSMGVLLYEMVTGRLPFEADTPAGTIYKIINDDPVPPAESGQGISRVLSRMILNALSKNPEERFASAAEMKAAIERCRQSTETPAAVIKETIGKLRAPRKTQGPGAFDAIRGRLRYWTEEYKDTFVVSGMATGCALTAAWSSTYLPFMEASVRLFAPVVAFFAALFIPPLGLALVLGMIAAGLWQQSMFLGGVFLALSIVYWLTLGRGFPQLAILPLLTPALAWLQMPFLVPLALGVTFGPVLAGFLAVFGALTLAGAELLGPGFTGNLDFTWTISASPELIKDFSFNNQVEDITTFADYFMSQPWLGAQIALWGGTACMMGFVRSLKNDYAPFVALGLGTAGTYLGYQVVSEMLGQQLEVDSSLVNPLLLSVAVLLALMFVFWHPRRS